MNRTHRNICGLMCWTLALLFFSVGLVQAYRKTSFEQLKAARERHQAAVGMAAASEKERALTALIESAVYGIAIVDQKGTIVAWNPAMARLSGWPIEDALGKSLLDAIPVSIREKHAEAFKRVMADPKAHQKTQVVECELHPRDSTEKPVPVQVTVRVVHTSVEPYAIAIVDQRRLLVEVESLPSP